MQQQGLDVQKLQQEVKARWLKPKEVLHILQNHEIFTVAYKTPQKPPSGSWFLFNRRVLRYFRNDGYEWRKKKNGKTIAEAHERLKVDNVEALNCYYAHAEKDPRFQRRIYWLLDPAYEHIVLVHYRDVLEGSISVSALNDSSTSNQNGSVSRAEAHGSPGLTVELIAPYVNSCSPESAEEVSSQIVITNNETKNTNQSDWIQHQAALRKLKMQLSLEDKEHHDVNTKEVQSTNEPIIVHGIQNEEPDTFRNLVDVFDGLEFTEGNHTRETGTHPYPNAIDVLKNSDTWLEEDQLEVIFQSSASMTVTENQWFHIHEVSPEWAFCSESTKVMIAGDFLCNPFDSSWAILFGDAKVSLETVQQGVIRCHTPCHDPGKVTMYMVDGNGKRCSEAREFVFRENSTKNMINVNGKPCSGTQGSKFRQKPTKSNDELLLLLNYVQMLLDGHGSENIKQTCEHLDHENTVDCVMEILLSNKFEGWLSSKCELNSEGNQFLPRQYHDVIHTISALGYNWALKPLLSSGVPINYRDSNGWTALHWAARFGREEMAAALIAAGAAAGALSDPTSEDPAAKTPASIASAYGFKGLSAFLSETELSTQLHSLESKENGNRRGHALLEGISSAVSGVSEKFAHVHGGTDDLLALKDSLGAVQNAVQAAGRIQAAFRVFSFRKKKETSLQSRDSNILCLREAGSASRAMLEEAALSIQKNFRCWKKRKEFLKIRRDVIKIQARVRAHQERNMYKGLLRSVGILDKVMLRWHRKGVGLRGFNSGAMPIDGDEEDDIVRVFRKQRVETALNEAVSRVTSIIHSPVARQQYRRMLEIYQEEKHDHGKQQLC